MDHSLTMLTKFYTFFDHQFSVNNGEGIPLLLKFIHSEKATKLSKISTVDLNIKVEKILKGSLYLIPSPSPLLKIQIMGGKVCLSCKVLEALTSPSNVLLLTLLKLTDYSKIVFYYHPSLWQFSVKSFLRFCTDSNQLFLKFNYGLINNVL